jgi:hypothetical protein
MTDSNYTPLPTEPENAPQQLRRRHKHRSKGLPRLLRKLRRRTRQVAWGSLTLVVLALLAVLIVASLVVAADGTSRVQSSLTSLNRVLAGLNTKPRTEITLADFDRLDTSVNELVNNLQMARRQLGLFRPLSGLNSTLHAALTQLDASLDLALAAQEMLGGLRPTLFFLVSGNTQEQVAARISSGERMVELLQLGRGAFLRAAEHLNTARTILDQIDIRQLSPDLVLRIDSMVDYHQQLVQANDILLSGPELLNGVLGLDGERSYLVLSQNSDELRPSGGYISTFGWMTMRNGRITGYSYSPTTATSPNPPPAALASQVNVPDWWIRYSQPLYAAWDGSWYANFPQTAQMAMWYYNSGNNPRSPVDGVIAIDIIGFEQILDALGRVSVPGYEGYASVITTENFRDVVYTIRENRDGEHKRFVAALYQQIFQDWQEASADPRVGAQLLARMFEALQQKHIMFYFAEPELNRAVYALGWAGAQAPARENDYLLVADANLGNKSNRSIFRQWTHDVTIEADGSLLNRATVAYDYSDRVAARDPAVNPLYHGRLDYNNLLQVFVPPGSRLEATNLTRAPEVVTTDTHTIFVSRVTVPYDGAERFQFTYRTPPLVQAIGGYQRYRLLLQKQPGTLGDVASVQIKLPPNATIIGVNPAPLTSYNLDQPILEFRFTLDTDQWIELIYSQ